MDIPVTGIGASAGGIKAFETFFKSMPVTKSTAFVLIQHLDPNHDSTLDQIVSRHTKMNVKQISGGETLQGGNIYVIPPNKQIEITDGKLELYPLQRENGRQLPIDTFFRSLSRALKEKSIGIILSGTGSDGSLGIKDIKEMGGLTIVEDPASAEHVGMPQHALDTGIIDYAIPIEEMPSVIQKYIESDYEEKRVIKKGEEDTENYLTRIFELIKKETNHDFNSYKRSTIDRRIERRLSVKQVDSLKAYYELIKDDQDEIHALFKELLISVTSFFRDREVFDYVEKNVLPDFIKRLEDDELRVWVPACATGEEAYSWAMLLKNFIDNQEKPLSLKVFASDIDAEALQTARRAMYPKNIEADVPDNLLKKYFLREEGKFKLRKSLREQVLFAEQNVLQDPPYSNIHLLSSRNFLIYLDAGLQQRAIAGFHYGLKENGILVLGNSETLGQSDQFFSPIHRKHRVFKKIQSNAVTKSMWSIANKPRKEESKTKPRTKKEETPSETAQRIILSRFAPPSAVINPEGELLYNQGDTSKYLTFGTGEISTNILKVAREGLKIALSYAIRKVKSTSKENTQRNVKFKLNNQYELVDLIVTPLKVFKPDSELLMVVFQPSAKTLVEKSKANDSPSDSENDRIVELEKELSEKENYLQTTIEELETTNEELKSSNEEAQSTNEELQSTNEELETSKEELQSLNEELGATNGQLYSKIDQLTEANNILNNLFGSTRIATVFLDKNMKIYSFTPAISSIMALQKADIGRPVTNFTNNLKEDDATIPAMAEKVIADLVPRSQEVKTTRGKYYWMRVLPYRTMEDSIEGVVITFTDITETRRQNEELVKHRHHLEELVDEKSKKLKESEDRFKKISGMLSDLAYMVKMPDEKSFKMEWQFGQYEEYTGISTNARISHQDLLDVTHPEDKQIMQQRIEGMVNGKEVHSEYRIRSKDGNYRWLRDHSVPQFDKKGKLEAYIGAAKDITAVKEAERQLKETQEKVRNISENIPGLVIQYKLNPNGDDELLYIRGVEDIYEISREDALANVALLWERIHPDDKEEFRRTREESASTGNIWQIIHRVILPGNRVKWLSSKGMPKKSPDGSVIWDTIGIDITELKQAEERVRQSENRFRSIFDNSGIGMLLSHADGSIESANEKSREIFGYTHDELRKKNIFDLIHPDDIKLGKEKLKPVLEGKEDRFFVEKRYLNASGEVVWGRVNGSVVNRENKKATLLLIQIEDVSRQVEVARALKKSEKKLLEAQKMAKLGHFEWILSENKIIWSDELFRMHGLKPQPLTFELVQKLVHPADYDFYMKKMEEQQNRNEKLSIEIRTMHKNGKVLWTRQFAKPVTNKQGKVEKFIGTVQDVTAEKLTMNALTESERKFKNIANNIPGLITKIKEYPNGNIETLYLSKGVQELTGLTQKKLNNDVRNYWKLILPEDWETFSLKMRQSANNLSVWEMEYRIRITSGKIKWIHGRSVPNKLESGEIIWDSLGIDITEKKVAEEALRKSEKQFKNLFDDDVAPKLIIDASTGKIIDSNDAAISFYRYPKLIGLSVYDINTAKTKTIDENMNKTSSREQNRFSLKHRLGDGAVRDVEVHSSPIEMEGKMVLVSTIIDITQKEEHLRRIEQNEKELKELNATKDRFFSIIAHDLRNPFNSLMGFSDIILRNIKQNRLNEIEHHVTIMNKAAHQGTNLLNNLLEWSRSQSGRLKFAPEYHNLYVIADGSLEMLSGQAQEKGITLEMKISAAHSIFADANMLHTIFRNLISNAIKYTPEKGKITIQAQPEKQGTNISVTDTGIGIAKADQKRLFKIEEDFSTPGTSNEAGTGLGLILCKEFVEKHHGKIWFDSKVGEGTTFTFFIPEK